MTALHNAAPPPISDRKPSAVNEPDSLNLHSPRHDSTAFNLNALISQAHDFIRNNESDKAHQIYKDLIDRASHMLRSGIASTLPVVGKIYRKVVEHAAHLKSQGYSDQAYKVVIALLETAYYFELNGQIREAELIFYTLNACTNASFHKLVEVRCGIERSSLQMAKNFDRIQLKAMNPSRMAAQCFIGTLYLNGDYGINQDTLKALKWFIMAAKQNCVLAQSYIKQLSRIDNIHTPHFYYQLGSIYFFGRYGIDRDASKATLFFSCAASHKHAKARQYLIEIASASNSPGYSCANYYLYRMYYNGYGVPPSVITAINYLAAAASNGDAVSMQTLKDYANNTLSKACKNANFQLGSMYFHGLGVDENELTATRYFASAASQGHTDSLKYLNHITNLPKNAGYSCANYTIGMLCAKEWIGFKNKNHRLVASAFFYKAATQRHAGAIYALQCLAHPINSNSIEFPIVNYWMSQLYETDCGVTFNMNKAFRHLTFAAEHGQLDALYRLGEIYELGCADNGIEDDAAEAIKKYEKIYTSLYDALKELIENEKFNKINADEANLLGAVSVKLAIYYGEKHDNRPRLHYFKKENNAKSTGYWNMALNLKHPAAMAHFFPELVKNTTESPQVSSS